MELTYQIKYGSTNDYYKIILEYLIRQNGINAKCTQYSRDIILEIDDSEEKIEEFFKALETKLPLSIFLEGANVVDAFATTEEPLRSCDLIQNISPTNDEVLNLLEKSNYDFSKTVADLKQGKIVRVKTSNGEKLFAMPLRENREAFEKMVENATVFVANTNAISELFIVGNKDIQLLSSIERPKIKLKFNILKNKDLEYSYTNFAFVKLPDDEATFVLANELRKQGIDFVIYCNEDPKQLDLKVTYYDNKVLPIIGDKAIFPKYDYASSLVFENSKEYFEHHGGVFKATLSQHNKRINPSIGVYFSKKAANSAISVNIPGKGTKDVLTIPNISLDLDDCLEEISSIDENSIKLIENYKKRFPKPFESKKVFYESNGFESILNVIAYLLEMKDFRDFEANALSANLKGGLQIDMKFVEINGVNYLDYRKTVASILSYKMADVTNSMIAYSFYESLSDLIKDMVGKVASEINTKDVVFCGSVFSNSTLLAKLKKDIGSTFNIMLPKEYPLDWY